MGLYLSIYNYKYIYSKDTKNYIQNWKPRDKKYKSFARLKDELSKYYGSVNWTKFIVERNTEDN